MSTAPLDPIVRLIAQLARLPGIGEKTATRLAFHILRQPKAYPRGLAEALVDVSEKIRLCATCQNFTADERCRYCADPRREDQVICVVENVQTLRLIEETHVFHGRYHVLHGLLAPLDGVGPNELRIRELLARLQAQTIKEIIFALSPTVEGDATLLYLHKLVQPLQIAMSRLAQGVAIGADLEWTDPATLSRALQERSGL